MRQTVSTLDRFLAGIVIAMAHTQFLILQLMGRLVGPNRMTRIMKIFFEHPLSRAGASAIGVPDMAERAGEKMSQIKARTPEAQHWQAFIQNYGANPEPDKVPDLFAWMEDACVMEDPGTELPMAAAFGALFEKHPGLAAAWKAEFFDLWKRERDVLIMAAQERAGWNDYYMVRWFILRDDDTVREIGRRATRDGEIGATATWMIASVSNQMPEFKAALGRVGYITPDVDAEFDCGDTTVKVGPGPHQITRMTNGGMRMTRPLPPPNAGEILTPQEEAAIYAKFAIFAECGPYKLLNAVPPGPQSNFWTFQIAGPGFPGTGVSIVAIDETCGRSIIGGLATAWRAGRIEGRAEVPECQTSR